MITRPDSPSEINAPSRATGSAEEAKTSVSLADLWLLAPKATATVTRARRPRAIEAFKSLLIRCVLSLTAETRPGGRPVCPHREQPRAKYSNVHIGLAGPRVVLEGSGKIRPCTS